MNFNLDEVQNGTVVDQNGDKIGSVGQIYLDDVTDQPTWVTVNTGLFGNKESFIPLNGANISGSEIRVPYTKDFVKDAPNVDDDGHIGEAEQDELYRYYSMDNTRTDVDVDRAAAADVDVDRDRTVEGDSVVRREEQLNVGKERVEGGKVRLRKHVVTEQQTVNVPVEREEVEVVREPIADGRTGGELREETIEATTSAERAVVDKEVVDVERVGLDKRTVTENQQVTADVSHEEIEIEHEGGERTRYSNVQDRDADFERRGYTREGDSWLDKAGRKITGA